MMKFNTIFFLLLIIAGSCFAQTKKTVENPNEKLIDALVNAPELQSYYDDGAGDATVLEIDGDNKVRDLKKEVRDILLLKQKAIPLLIEHLSDERLTAATFSGGFISPSQTYHVPVGFICLDILTSIIGNNKTVYYKYECGDDGMGSCINEGFYFRPDDYKSAGKELHQRDIVNIVRKNWEKAYRLGKIKYNFKSKF